MFSPFFFVSFFFNDTATTEIYTLSLHDALPISHAGRDGGRRHVRPRRRWLPPLLRRCAVARAALREDALRQRRSEEHTSELQSRRDLVCRLLLEKKKKKDTVMEICILDCVVVSF